jgi:hypothetical protein
LIVVPALLTSASSRPNSDPTRVAMAVTAAASATSAWASRVRAPSAWASFATASAAARLDAKLIATSYPAPAKASVVLRPMPRDAPVTSAAGRAVVI